MLWDLRTLGVYSNTCECGQVYTGQSDQYIQIRIKNTVDTYSLHKQKNQQ